MCKSLWFIYTYIYSPRNTCVIRSDVLVTFRRSSSRLCEEKKPLLYLSQAADMWINMDTPAFVPRHTRFHSFFTTHSTTLSRSTIDRSRDRSRFPIRLDAEETNAIRERIRHRSQEQRGTERREREQASITQRLIEGTFQLRVPVCFVKS